GGGGESIYWDQFLLGADTAKFPTQTIFPFDEKIFAFLNPPQLNRTLMGGGCLQSSASKCKRGNYEKMCPMSRKTWIRRPLPYFLERTLVGTRSLLFGSLRR